MKTGKNETPGYYAVIPAPVLFARNINDTQRVLYGHISTLCNKNWECNAGNEYFAKAMSKWTEKKKEKEKEKMNAKYISSLINDLKKKWYIDTRVEKDLWNQRIITLTDLLKLKKEVIKTIQKKQDSYPEKSGEGYPEKSDQPYPEKSEHNNTSDNNTSSNDITEQGSDDEKSDEEKPKEYGNKEINDLIKKLREKAWELWIVYSTDWERNFSKHILWAKDFWQLADAEKKSRTALALWIMELSMQYWGDYPAWWPKKIYLRRSTILNAYKLEKIKLKSADPISYFIENVENRTIKQDLIKRYDGRKDKKLPTSENTVRAKYDEMLEKMKK